MNNEGRNEVPFPEEMVAIILKAIASGKSPTKNAKDTWKLKLCCRP